WQLPEATEAAFDGGRFRSADVAVVDKDGYVYVVDRIKDMIISGGENVYPAEVQDDLYAHPAVAERAVTGLPVERWDEVRGAEVGRALRDSGLGRHEVFVTTKLPPSQAGRARATLAASLHALETEYVDLWLVHWPPSNRALVPTWQELLAVRDEGLARAVGV